jgi:7-cyano-7-deazaguanine synthase
MSEAQLLVLLSGGLDSLGCLEHYKRIGKRAAALFVDYGQPARNAELKAATGIAHNYGASLEMLELKFAHVSAGEIVGRNAMLLSIALMQIGSKFGLVSLGIHAGTPYADCGPGFIERMQSVFDVATSGRIRIDAPFIHLSKVDIWRFLLESGAPVELAYSCESGNSPCGQCLSCMDRAELHAFSN